MTDMKAAGGPAPCGEARSSQHGRVMGLDFGGRTVGVAISDPMRMTARGLEIIRRKDETHLRATFRRLLEIKEEYAVSEIVLGLPLNMDDSVGERARKTLLFRDELVRKLGIPVHMMDERLTTVEAEEAMSMAGVKRSEFKNYVDQIAAAIILKDYLDHYGNN